MTLKGRCEVRVQRDDEEGVGRWPARVTEMTFVYKTFRRCSFTHTTRLRFAPQATHVSSSSSSLTSSKPITSLLFYHPTWR